MTQPLPYCGTAPIPGDILSRFNLDARLILALAVLALWHSMVLRRADLGSDRAGLVSHGPSAGVHARRCALLGWAVAAMALISPLCALSVALFSARVGQHMLLVLVAAPLIAAGLPAASTAAASACADAIGADSSANVRRAHDADSRGAAPWLLWLATAVFFAALWFWHMPVPYDATFASDWIYWTMHVSLFGSAILLWRELLHHSRRRTGSALVAGALTFVHMGLLGAILALGDRPLFFAHLSTTGAWGLTPLEDQALGGTLMWVPGIALFLWSAIRSVRRLQASLDGARAP